MRLPVDVVHAGRRLDSLCTAGHPTYPAETLAQLGISHQR